MSNVAEAIPQIFDNPYFEAAGTYYDPERKQPQHELGAFLLSHYELGGEDPNSPLVAGTIAADLLDAGAHSTTALRSGARTRAELLGVEQGIADANLQASAQAGELLSFLPDLAASQRALAAANELALKVHGSTWRKSGKNAYDHPLETAAIALAGLEATEQLGWDVPHRTKEQVVISSLLHDTLEDGKRGRTATKTGEELSVSPFLVQRTLQLAGVDYGTDIARTLQHLTRVEGGLPKQVRGWGRSYTSYILHGRTDPGFCVVKPADIIHNSKLDPKPTPTPEAEERWQEKLVQYGWAFKFIREQAVLKAGQQGWPEWLPQYLDAITAVTAEELPKRLNRLEAFVGQPLPAPKPHEQGRAA